MKVGLIARCDDRGLGVLSFEAWRHLQPDRTLVVLEPGAQKQGFEQHPGRYGTDATVVEWYDASFDDTIVRPWLAGLDVLYSAETFYDQRVVEWCREAGVRTVLHAMPEFWRADALPPDVVWAPTTWRLNTLPADTRLVPVPVAGDRFSASVRDEACTFLHVVGHRAALDRAGTTALLRALRLVATPLHVRLITQDEALPRGRNGQRHHIDYVLQSKVDYWRLYDDADVLVSPRRYGGLSLPWGEACAAGLALVVPDVEPNREWPAAHVPAPHHGYLRTSAGDIDVCDVSTPDLAHTLSWLASSPAEVRALSERSLEWAAAHSWEALLPLYRAELERACS